LAAYQRSFVYLTFEHSEALEDQEVGGHGGNDRDSVECLKVEIGVGSIRGGIVWHTRVLGEVLDYSLGFPPMTL
jgi:hypothetical protein